MTATLKDTDQKKKDPKKVRLNLKFSQKNKDRLEEVSKASLDPVVPWGQDDPMKELEAL
jgi:hypothetical protein